MPHAPPRPAMSSHPQPLGPQVLMNPRTAIPILGGLITGPNVGDQQLVLTRPPALRAAPPRVKAAPCDLEHPTQESDWIVRLLRLDLPIPHDDSLAKKAIAFFKMSRSCRSCSTSRRKTLSSSVARKQWTPEVRPRLARSID